MILYREPRIITRAFNLPPRRPLYILCISDFETMFTKHSPSEILNLNVKKMTVFLTAIFRFNSPPFFEMKWKEPSLHRKDTTTSFTENAVFENLKAQNSRAA